MVIWLPLIENTLARSQEGTGDAFELRSFHNEVGLLVTYTSHTYLLKELLLSDLVRILRQDTVPVDRTQAPRTYGRQQRVLAGLVVL